MIVVEKGVRAGSRVEAYIPQASVDRCRNTLDSVCIICMEQLDFPARRFVVGCC